MSRTKGLAAFLAACLLILQTSGDGSVLAASSEIQTTTVEKGSLVVSATADVSVYYPDREEIYYESDYGWCSYLYYYVASGEYVHKGDPIAEISIDVDAIAMEEIRVKLQRAREDLQAFVDSSEEQLLRAQEAIDNAEEGEKEIAILQKEKLKEELDYNMLWLQKNVEDLEKSLKVYEQAASTTTLVAPEDGIVGNLEAFWPNQMLAPHSKIGEIYLTNRIFFEVKDPNKILQYGMDVVLTDRDGNTYPATVISSNHDTLSENQRMEKAYIMALAEVGSDAMRKLTVTYETVHMDNVLIVNASCLKNDTGGTYMMVYDNEKLLKQYVTVAKIAGGTAHILDGAKEGMKVVVY